MTGRKSQPSDGQLPLAGFGMPATTARLPNRHRLFLGMFPDAATARTIEAFAASVCNEHQVRGKPLLRDRFHVTLHHLGDYVELPPGRVDAALAAIARIEVAEFRIEFARLGSFRGRLGNHPCVLLRDPAAADDPARNGVHTLWHEARVQLAAEGFASSLGREFTPHVTLLYGDRRLPVTIPVEPIAWTVRDIVLVHSLLGRTEHRFLGRHPFAVARESGGE